MDLHEPLKRKRQLPFENVATNHHFCNSKCKNNFIGYFNFINNNKQLHVALQLEIIKSRKIAKLN